MRKADAVLIKRETEDGLGQVKDHVPIGKHYTIDLDTVQEADAFNIVERIHHQKQVVMVLDDDGGWYPFMTELLYVEGLSGEGGRLPESDNEANS